MAQITITEKQIEENRRVLELRFHHTAPVLFVYDLKGILYWMKLGYTLITNYTDIAYLVHNNYGHGHKRRVITVKDHIDENGVRQYCNPPFLDSGATLSFCDASVTSHLRIVRRVNYPMSDDDRGGYCTAYGIEIIDTPVSWGIKASEKAGK